jgi:ubiquinone/menaquinone biosynthesis C-methylase UbiE
LASLFTRTSQAHDSSGTRLFAHFGARLVERARLKAGDQVLDVGAGTGATLLPAARQVGPAGHVIGIDLAPGMIDRLADAIAAEGLTNADAEVGDGEDLSFADSSFDAVLCAFTLFFFQDRERALDGFRRVLRAGGTLAVSTFTKEGSVSIDRVWERISEYIERPPPGLEVQFDEPVQLHEALAAAGFVDIEVEESPLEVVMPTFQDWWAWLWSMEFRDALERMDAQTLNRFRTSAERDLGQGPGGPGITFRMDAMLTRARKP